MASMSVSRNKSIPQLRQQIDVLQGELERNRRVLEVLYNISLACHGITSFRDIFEAICRELRMAFAFDACYIALCDIRRPDIFRAVLMVDEGLVEYYEHMEIGTLTGLLLRERRPLLFRDLSEERKSLDQPPDPFGAEQKRSRAWLGVPLLIGQDAVGVISIQSYQAGLYDETDRDLLQRLGNVVAVALENAYLDQNQRSLSVALSDQVAARTVELATLSAIAAALVLQYPLSVLLERALELIVPLFGLEGGSVRILDAQRNELVLAAQRGLPEEYLEETVRLPVEGNPVGRVVHEDQPLIISDGLDWSWRAASLPFASVLGVPLRIGGRVLGVLSLLGKQAHQFDQQQIDLAQAVGNQLAIAIENAYLFEEQERQIAELSALGGISRAAGTAHDLRTLLRQVHDALQPLMRPDAFSMVVYDPERQILTDGISIDEGEEYAYWRNQPPPPDSLTAWLIRHQRTLHFDDLAAEIGQYPDLSQHLVGAGKQAVSWLGVPLLSRDGAVVGMIAVQSYRPAAFDARDEAFLLNVARQVALHVQNVGLLTQRERQIRELDAIGRIGELISASFDLDEMLDVVYQTLQQVTQASVFCLLICKPETHIITNAMFVEQEERVELAWNGQPPAPDSLTDWILRQREPLLFVDLLRERAQLAEQGITPVPQGPENPVRSWAGVPLLAQDGEAIGVLSVQHYDPDMYDQQTLDFLGQVASHISLGVQKVRLFEERERQLAENARLFAEAQDHAAAAERQAQRMELVNRISLVLSSRLDQQEVLDLAAQELVRLFWADHTGILLFEEQGQWGIVIAEYPLSGALGVQLPLANNPIIEELIISRRPVCITSIATDPRAVAVRDNLERLGVMSLMVVPLVSRGQVIGSIGLDSLNQSRVFTAEEQDLFLTIAASIASAVENARLFAAEQEARRTADTLREVARVLSSSFDTREVLQLILRELRNMIVYDTASIMLIERDTLRFAAYSGFDPDLNLHDLSFPLDQRSGAWLVVSRREPVIISDTTASPVWRRDLALARIRSWLGVPMIVKGVVMGVLNIDSYQPNTFTARDGEAAQAFADQAAVALENALLYEESVTRVEQELEIARRIQSNLFPRTLPQLAGLALDARCLPARETGGDFFDFVTLEEGAPSTGAHDAAPGAHSGTLAIIVGDASGKSITGAMLMAIARSIVRSEARNHQVPETVMRETNRWIVEDVPRRSFVALSYATIDLSTRRLALANGGQLAPLRRRPGGQIEYLEVPGPTLPVGILPDTPYAACEVALQAGDLLVFYTDGIVEARDSQRQLFGFERLEALVRDHGDLPPSELIDLVLQEIAAFMGDTPQHDDMTIVALRVE
jgi:phosphoserine phosphatase RsbU/P